MTSTLGGPDWQKSTDSFEKVGFEFHARKVRLRLKSEFLVEGSVLEFHVAAGDRGVFIHNIRVLWENLLFQHNRPEAVIPEEKINLSPFQSPFHRCA
ncbi:MULTISPECIES: hypothetical protein [Pseudomonas]|uniref:hypothetical protein n=1 Tax=Pseudomonas TaxID=286 RepID=UPI000ADB4388|nr:MULTISPECIES: hypothetical protein [Pseudomonas]MBP1124532.1 hypothetical protein [Pseudomonas sp. PvP025]MDQ0398392.1 hypothetical protein [Pseudomonas sp. PvP006]